MTCRTIAASIAHIFVSILNARFSSIHVRTSELTMRYAIFCIEGSNEMIKWSNGRQTSYHYYYVHIAVAVVRFNVRTTTRQCDCECDFISIYKNWQKRSMGRLDSSSVGRQFTRSFVCAVSFEAAIVAVGQNSWNSTYLLHKRTNVVSIQQRRHDIHVIVVLVFSLCAICGMAWHLNVFTQITIMRFVVSGTTLKFLLRVKSVFKAAKISHSLNSKLCFDVLTSSQWQVCELGDCELASKSTQNCSCGQTNLLKVTFVCPTISTDSPLREKNSNANLLLNNILTENMMKKFFRRINDAGSLQFAILTRKIDID